MSSPFKALILERRYLENAHVPRLTPCQRYPLTIIMQQRSKSVYLISALKVLFRASCLDLHSPKFDVHVHNVINSFFLFFTEIQVNMYSILRIIRQQSEMGIHAHEIWRWLCLQREWPFGDLMQKSLHPLVFESPKHTPYSGDDSIAGK